MRGFGVLIARSRPTRVVCVIALASACKVDDRTVEFGADGASDASPLSGSPNEPAADTAPAGTGIEVATGCPPGGCVDCAGVAGGSARVDECGTCDTDLANDCPRDCAGTWGGSALRDLCGVCDADPTNDCQRDCQSMAGGTARVDNCGVCDANPSNDCVMDCQGQWGGEATVDPCGVCDRDPANDCVSDCLGVAGGPARLDACGACDDNPSNDCFDGSSGSIVATDTAFDIGNGLLSWTFAVGQLGFLSYFQSAAPPIAPLFARVTGSWGCIDQVEVNGYEGFASVRDIGDASGYAYFESVEIGFGTRASECQAGLLLFSWAGQYGVLDFESIDETGTTLTVRYWLANPGVSDFSNAPE